ncbi:ABC transporter substrate-binding protein [Cryptosporangium aurantiacum]|uniref:Branched-chain amino acid transport system substrate-binding protein n=1 Tax=Cryptosporangium aurantiacum TaxID=134849 RepID=A0A1M7PEQ1_9ACTN|nr:ABC transporter substrate-binding protein [Cryptosporangium aurantiacum]SHN15175.1 branched-chain amino acid transport system substrate-binding protein [Cryptosporangium aurantiacum]
MPTRRTSIAAALAAAMVAIALTACDKAPDTTAEPSGSATSEDLSAESVRTMLAYTGGKEGTADKTPITIGYVNSEGGPNAFPDYTTQIESAVALVNSKLGGIDGHPIQLKKCLVPGVEEQGQKCAQEFLSDPKVVAVLEGALDTGAQSFHSTLGGKLPVLGMMATSLAGAHDRNAYYLSGGQFGAASLVTYAKEHLKAKSVAMISAAGLPVAVQAATALKNGFRAAGIDVTQATYAPTSTDYVPSITASGAQKADMVLPLVVVPGQCLALAKALQQVPVTAPVVTFNSCLGSAVEKGLGDYPKWTYMSPTVNGDSTDANPETAAQIKAYQEWFTPLRPTVTTAASGVQSLQLTLTLAKLLQGSGDTVTAQTSAASFKSFTEPVFLGSPRIAFGANPAFPAVGSLANRFYTYEGKDTWKDATGGQWVVPAIPRS